MGDPADVGFVDAHAKGDGGHHDQPVLLLKADFDMAAGLGLHPAVIEGGGMAFGAQGGGKRFGLGPRGAIDDAGLAAPGGGKGQKLVARAVLDGEGQVDVGPVKAAQEAVGGDAIKQAGDNLGPGFLVGGGGEGGQRHAQGAAQLADA